MSVTCIQNVGQYGNQLFPTVLAALAAKKHKLNVKHFENKLVVFRPPEKYESEYGDIVSTKDPLSEVHKKRNIIMKRGYYQDHKLFNPYREEIKERILALPAVEKNEKDVVMHLRLDGFNHEGHNSHIIQPEWYVRILKGLKFEKLYIVMATKSGRIWKKQEPHKARYIEYFKEFNPIIVSEDEYTDFNFIRRFDKIISSNSTFSWWASFCSDATNIYLPPFWEGKNANLSEIGKESKVVEEEYGYVNIETMEKVPITFQ